MLAPLNVMYNTLTGHKYGWNVMLHDQRITGKLQYICTESSFGLYVCTVGKQPSNHRKLNSTHVMDFQ